MERPVWHLPDWTKKNHEHWSRFEPGSFGTQVSSVAVWDKLLSINKITSCKRN
jgi:hypothetical protein